MLKVLRPSAIREAEPAMSAFIAGAASGVASSALSYLSQTALLEIADKDRAERIGGSFRIAAILTVFFGLAAFACGG